MTTPRAPDTPLFSIVYVDDDPVSRQQFRDEIELQDLENPVHYIETGEELIRRLETRELSPYPGVILVALHLPGMDGDELVRRIRHDHKHLDLSPVMLVVNDDEGEADARARGLADGWIGKPFRFPVLLSLLRRKGRRFTLTIRDRGYEDRRGNV